jgi:hypothetical protein
MRWRAPPPQVSPKVFRGHADGDREPIRAARRTHSPETPHISTSEGHSRLNVGDLSVVATLDNSAAKYGAWAEWSESGQLGRYAMCQWTKSLPRYPLRGEGVAGPSAGSDHPPNRRQRSRQADWRPSQPVTPALHAEAVATPNPLIYGVWRTGEWRVTHSRTDLKPYRSRLCRMQLHRSCAL